MGCGCVSERVAVVVVVVVVVVVAVATMVVAAVIMMVVVVGVVLRLVWMSEGLHDDDDVLCFLAACGPSKVDLGVDLLELYGRVDLLEQFCVQPHRDKEINTTLHKLQTFCNRCLYRILRIHWPEKVTNERSADKSKPKTCCHTDHEKKVKLDRPLFHETCQQYHWVVSDLDSAGKQQ